MISLIQHFEADFLRIMAPSPPTQRAVPLDEFFWSGGGSGGLLRTKNYFIFMGNFRENKEKLNE